MAFVKLDCGILTSTTWMEKDVRDIFITALLMATPEEVTEDAPEISTHCLDHTGWIVPPGWYGFVHAAGPGICRMAMVDREPGLAALEILSQPEPESRTQDFEGRRMVRVNGGFLILNFQKYRDKDHTAAARMRRFRERQKDVLRRNDTSLKRNDTQAEAEAEAEADKKKETTYVDAPPASATCPYQKIVDLYHKHFPTGSRVKAITNKRKKAIKARWVNNSDLEYWADYFSHAATSKFLTGQNDRSWRADIDFFIRPDTATFMQEGKYHK
jgi:hypothetical protein